MKNKFNKADIACIFTNKSVCAVAKKVMEEEKRPYAVHFAPMEDAVKVAQQEINKGIRIIISRGGVASKLQSTLKVPIINVRYTFVDFALSIQEARKLSDKIAIVSYGIGIEYAERFREFFDADIRMVQVNSPANMLDCIKKLKKEGVQVIVGGYSSTEIARKLGLQAVTLGCNKHSMLDAITDAEHLLAINNEQETKQQIISAVLSVVRTGILILDRQGKITSMNKIAQAILKKTTPESLGKPYNEIFPHPEIVEPTLSGISCDQKIITHENQYLVASSSPIHIHSNKNVGAVIEIQNQQDVQNAERKLRSKLLQNGFVAKHTFDDILGISTSLRAVKEKAKLYASVGSTILLYGESGTGKEIFAQSIHNGSPRRGYPFVTVNCAALPEDLLESILFGYDKGTFTGAQKEGKAGLFELAHQGTIFLDEIGEMPLSLQPKLLRVIQEKEVVRLGGAKVTPVDVRILAATNKNLLNEVKEGHFRSDLYYRLCVLPLTIPPLRERKEDIGLLTNRFIQYYSGKYRKSVTQISPEAFRLLSEQNFPGNVRELSNIVERAVVLCQGKEIDRKLIWDVLNLGFDTSTAIAANAEKKESLTEKSPISFSSILPTTSIHKRKKEQEKEAILQALRECEYHKGEAAELLGISRATLWRKMKNYHIE